MTQEQLIDKHYSTLFEVWQGSERKALLLSCLHTIASDLLFARVARRVTSEVDLSHGDLQAYFKRNVTILAEVLQRFAASTNQVLSINLVDWVGSTYSSVAASCLSSLGVTVIMPARSQPSDPLSDILRFTNLN